MWAIEESSEYAYPIPDCVRIDPVPKTDTCWDNDKHGKSVDSLSICEDKNTGTKKAKSSAMKDGTHQVYTLVPGVMMLKDTGAFPPAETFIRAKEQLASNNFKIGATLPDFDKHFLNNIKDYAPVPTDAKYFKQVTLQGIPTLHKTIFTSSRLNNLATAVFSSLSSACKNKDRANKDYLAYFSRLATHAYGVINGRFLQQCPEADGKKSYSSAKPDYLMLTFQIRDLHCRPDFADFLQKQDVKTLDMYDMARQCTLLEFIWVAWWVVVKLIEAEGKVAFCTEAHLKDHIKDQADHRPSILCKARIRVMYIHGLHDMFNMRSREVHVNESAGMVTRERITVVDEGRGKGMRILDRYRMILKSSTNPFDTLKKGQTTQVNWPAALGLFSLLSWPELDPTRAPFDSTAVLLQQPTDRKAMEMAIKWQFIQNIGDLAGFKIKTDSLYDSTCSHRNSLRYRYTIWRDRTNTLHYSAPLGGDLGSYEHLPLNLTLPAFRWILRRIKEVPPAAPDDSQRRRLREVTGDSPSVGALRLKYPDKTVRFYAPFDDGHEVPPQVKELFYEQDTLPLEVRLQLDHTLRFSFRVPRNPPGSRLFSVYLKESIPCVPSGPAPLDEDVKELAETYKGWNIDPGTCSKEVLQQAAYLRADKSQHGKNLTGATMDLHDEVSQFVTLYKCYLRGCSLYKDEIDVFRHVVDHHYGGKIPTGYEDKVLESLKWGCRFWRELVKRSTIDVLKKRSMVAFQTRKAIREQYSEAPGTGSAATLHKIANEHLFESKTSLYRNFKFWNQFLESEKFASLERRDAVALALANGDEEHDLDDDGYSLAAEPYPDRVFMPLYPLAKDADNIVELKTWPDLVKEIKKRAWRKIVVPIVHYMDQVKPVPIAKMQDTDGAITWNAMKSALPPPVPGLLKEVSESHKRMRQFLDKKFVYTPNQLDGLFMDQPEVRHACLSWIHEHLKPSVKAQKSLQEEIHSEFQQFTLYQMVLQKMQQDMLEEPERPGGNPHVHHDTMDLAVGINMTLLGQDLDAAVHTTAKLLYEGVGDQAYRDTADWLHTKGSTEVAQILVEAYKALRVAPASIKAEAEEEEEIAAGVVVAMDESKDEKKGKEEKKVKPPQQKKKKPVKAPVYSTYAGAVPAAGDMTARKPKAVYEDPDIADMQEELEEEKKKQQQQRKSGSMKQHAALLLAAQKKRKEATTAAPTAEDSMAAPVAKKQKT